MSDTRTDNLDEAIELLASAALKVQQEIEGHEAFIRACTYGAEQLAKGIKASTDRLVELQQQLAKLEAEQAS